MSKRGFLATVPNKHGMLLQSVLSGFPVANYTWYTGPGEIYRSDNGILFSSRFNDSSSVNGTELESLVKQPSYVIFADLKAFPAGQVFEISDYNEYLKSTCELALFLYDCTQLELYCKNPEMLDQLYQNAHHHGFENIDYITDENDGRTSFSVL